MNSTVTEFLDALNLPLRKEIDRLREAIIKAHPNLEENIKWNGPNYKVADQDRISIKVHPLKSFTLILHRGSRVLEEPDHKLLAEDFGVLNWKSNDRAIATFKDQEGFRKVEKHITEIVKNWLKHTL